VIVVGVAQLLLACALLAVAAGATSVLLRPDSGIDASVTFGVVAAAGVVATLLLCGFAGELRPAPALGVVALWAIASAALARRAGLVPRRSRLLGSCSSRSCWRRSPSTR